MFAVSHLSFTGRSMRCPRPLFRERCLFSGGSNLKVANVLSSQALMLLGGGGQEHFKCENK